MASRPAILCVEDDDLHRQLVQEMARPAPVQFVDTLDAAEVAMGTGMFDVILLDLGLAETSGLDTCVDARRRFPNTPIVVHSGTDDETLMQACIAAGADDYIVKHDITDVVLMRSLEFAIERRERMRAELDARISREQRLALEEQLAMQTALLRTVGHELNTPLTPIRLRLGLLERHDDPSVRKAAEVIKRNLERLQRSLSNSLDAWQLAEQPDVGAQSTVDVQALLSEVLDDIRPLAERRGIEVRSELHQAMLVADPDRIHHLLSNLVHNAATHGSSWMSVHCGSDGGRAIVQISNGGALPPEVKQHLFQPFVNRYRRDDATDAGAGLGLHVAKTLAVSQNLGLALAHDDPVTFRLTQRKALVASLDPDQALKLRR